MALSSRLSAIKPFLAMQILREARELEAEGRDILHLEIGQTCFPPPERVRRRMADILAHGEPGYTQSLGLPDLRTKIAAYYGEAHDVDLDPGRVVVTAGSSGAFLLGFMMAFEPGARIGLARPWYPAYQNILSSLGFEPVGIATPAADDFKLKPEHLTAAGDLAGVIVTSPSNPTGSVTDADELAALSEAIAAQGGWLVSDEIYHGITYGTKVATAAALDGQVMVINSFSKYFAMPGFRIGWMIVPEGVAPKLEPLIQNMFISPPGLGQIGATEVLDCLDELDGYVAQYDRNRRTLMEGLRAMGLGDFPEPDGAFYIYPDVSAFTSDSVDFCRRILLETGIALTPGVDFDPEGGRTRIRFSYACDHATVLAAVDRLGRWLKKAA